MAFADSHLDKQEEGVIRRVADLLRLRYSEFVQSKLTARDSQTGNY